MNNLKRQNYEILLEKNLYFTQNYAVDYRWIKKVKKNRRIKKPDKCPLDFQSLLKTIFSTVKIKSNHVIYVDFCKLREKPNGIC